GNKIYVDLEIQLDGKLSLNKAHDIAEQLHDDLEKEFIDVKHVMVHVNPGNRK
ncbi:MAG: cation-efflux pump, partial [Bacilli bacterium]|nr:cation-efflux pump [Bacilli bacterium]